MQNEMDSVLVGGFLVIFCSLFLFAIGLFIYSLRGWYAAPVVATQATIADQDEV